jgi:hypothetical protein
MKFTQAISTAILATTIVWAGPASADGEGIGTPDGSYRGGGYQVISNPRNGTYTGIDRSGRKLVIRSRPSYPADQTKQWKNKSYTYRLTGIGEPTDGDGDYDRVMLTIVNPQGRTILNQMLNRVK